MLCCFMLHLGAQRILILLNGGQHTINLEPRIRILAHLTLLYHALLLKVFLDDQAELLQIALHHGDKVRRILIH